MRALMLLPVLAVLGLAAWLLSDFLMVKDPLGTLEVQSGATGKQETPNFIVTLSDTELTITSRKTGNIVFSTLEARAFLAARRENALFTEHRGMISVDVTPGDYCHDQTIERVGAIC